MTPERQREVIAEWCGWKEGGCGWWEGPQGQETPHLPDYIEDLNAMHEAENMIFHPKTWHDYVEKLIKVVGKSGSPVNATAAQRAEALLRTTGKWED